MTTKWMEGAHVLDLTKRPYSRGNGPFGSFYGVVLHVNVDEHGTPDSFWKNNSGQVTPNFQVYKSLHEGGIHQCLPFNWQPWCQVNGNFHYAAIETAGMPNELLTDYQCEAIASILSIYHREMNLTLKVANTPGQRGFGIHKMGGASWGGHNCPGDKRAAQRAHILSLVGSHPAPSPHPQPKPTPHASLKHAWPKWMPHGHRFGNIHGDSTYHGGIDTRERSAVALIQRRFQSLGLASKSVGWADGVWEKPTDSSAHRWHEKYMPHAHHMYSITEDAWRILFTY